MSKHTKKTKDKALNGECKCTVTAADAPTETVTITTAGPEAPAAPVKAPVRLSTMNYPGDPTCRSLVAYEPEEPVIARIFAENPSSKWIVTPTRIIDRPVKKE